MALDRLTAVLSAYAAGAITASAACVDLLDLAADADADTIFARLSGDLRSEVRQASDRLPNSPEDVWVVTSHGLPPEAQQRLTERVYRGMVAMHRVTRGTPGDG